MKPRPPLAAAGQGNWSAAAGTWPARMIVHPAYRTADHPCRGERGLYGLGSWMVARLDRASSPGSMDLTLTAPRIQRQHSTLLIVVVWADWESNWPFGVAPMGPANPPGLRASHTYGPGAAMEG